jgi:hypothetical protein
MTYDLRIERVIDASPKWFSTLSWTPGHKPRSTTTRRSPSGGSNPRSICALGNMDDHVR